ncbi:MAG: hypothetical protein Q7S17_06240 [Xanthobacteraceae bacterium]|nr:hypothetical protein [Xanthobacteraceae bacterium]
MATHHSARLLRLVLVVLPLGCGLAGCESFNPFAEKKTPLPGERKQIFSSGVPGVEFNAPPQQPSNSNVQIQTLSASQNPDRPVAEPGSPSAAQSEPSAAKQPAAKAASKSASKSAPKSASQSAPKPASKSASKPASDDPWADQR